VTRSIELTPRENRQILLNNPTTLGRNICGIRTSPRKKSKKKNFAKFHLSLSFLDSFLVSHLTYLSKDDSRFVFIFHRVNAMLLTTTTPNDKVKHRCRTGPPNVTPGRQLRRMRGWRFIYKGEQRVREFEIYAEVKGNRVHLVFSLGP
jgi:hypothetical protein